MSRVSRIDEASQQRPEDSHGLREGQLTYRVSGALKRRKKRLA